MFFSIQISSQKYWVISTVTAGDPQATTMDSMKISENKIKYINTNYQKLPHKIYDSKCDVKLSVGGISFRVHKEVLSEASDYFSAMFRHDMKEKEQDAIEIKEISPKGFSAILDYFYHGNITISPENIKDVLEVARFFQADWIVDVCCNYLVRHMSLENYSCVLSLADKYALDNMPDKIFHFLADNITQLMYQPKFLLNLPDNLLLLFLKENIYIEASEYFLLTLILEWVDQDPCARKPFLLPLLREIRFCLMEPEELDLIPKYVYEFEEIRNEIEEAKNYILCIPMQCLRNEEKLLQRGSRRVLAMIFFSDDRYVTNIAYRTIDREGICLEELNSSLDTLYEYTGQAVLGNFLFVAGGYTHNYCSSDRVFMFDPRYRIWIEVAAMQHPRVSFAMCSSDSRLFALCGINHTVTEDGESESILNTCEMYYPEENTWVDLPSLPLGIFDLACCFSDNVLYASGGISDDPQSPVPLPYLYAYRMGTETWEPKTPMIYSRQGHSMTAINSKLYALGGCTSLEDVSFSECYNNECYDIETNQWTEILRTPFEIGQLQRYVAQVDNKIYVIGGVNTYLYVIDTEENTLNKVETLGPQIHRVVSLNVAYPDNV